MKKEVFIIPMVPKWENKCLCGLGRVKKKKKAVGRGTVYNACLVSSALVHLSKESLVPSFPPLIHNKNDKFISAHSYTSEQTTAQLFWN